MGILIMAVLRGGRPEFQAAAPSGVDRGDGFRKKETIPFVPLAFRGFFLFMEGFNHDAA